MDASIASSRLSSSAKKFKEFNLSPRILLSLLLPNKRLSVPVVAFIRTPISIQPDTNARVANGAKCESIVRARACSTRFYTRDSRRVRAARASHRRRAPGLRARARAAYVRLGDPVARSRIAFSRILRRRFRRRRRGRAVKRRTHGGSRASLRSASIRRAASFLRPARQAPRGLASPLPRNGIPRLASLSPHPSSHLSLPPRS